MRVGIIGYGTIGKAIAAGLHAHDAVRTIAATTRRGLPIHETPFVTASTSNTELASQCDVLFLCVKPFQLEAVLRDITPVLARDTLVISTAASVTLAQMHEWSSNHELIVRAMPNMPCRIGDGMTVLAAHSVPDDRLALARSLFATLGRAIVIDERLMDAATGISGCGPAYIYLVIEALTDAGVKLGFSHDVARELVAQTVLGSARMVLQSDQHPAALKMEVTTPAGCTVDGLMELEDGKLRSTLLRAALAAATRSAQLAH
ncbi:MAG: pyrroline-5-carboxylate reductase [Vulcanimicrobiaceae bacterium]